MAEWLILRLPRTPEAPTQWLLADVHGQPLAAVQSGTLAEAAERLGSRRVCVVVPDGDVLLTDVELPVRTGARAQQLVPYALEEQLAADVDTLHFAVGPTLPDSSRTRVAVVARALMDEWLAMLTTARLTPTVLCPESALLPVNPGHLVALLEDDTLSLRRSDGSAPLTLPADDMAGGMTALLGAEVLLTAHIILYAGSQDWSRHTAAAESLRDRCAGLTVQLLGSGPLPLLAPQLPQANAFNLLQGTYAPKTDHSGELRRWRMAGLLAACLLLLHVGGQAFSLWRLDQTADRIDDDIQHTVTRYVPGDPGTGDVRARLQQRLLSTQAGGAGTVLVRGLGAVARAQGGAGTLTLEALTLRSGALELKVRAANADSLEHLVQSLHNSGWQADLTSGAAAAGGGYEGDVTMSSGAAP